LFVKTPFKAQNDYVFQKLEGYSPSGPALGTPMCGNAVPTRCRPITALLINELNMKKQLAINFRYYYSVKRPAQHPSASRMWLATTVCPPYWPRRFKTVFNRIQNAFTVELEVWSDFSVFIYHITQCLIDFTGSQVR